MYSYIIKNATVVDGTGHLGKTADVAVANDTIANIAPKINAPAETIIDATGMVLTPGFVDIQNHSDSYWQIFNNPSLDSLTTQGFTTVLVGNCGASLAPLLNRDSLLALQKWHNLEGLNVNWQSFSECLEALSKTPVACNIASLVGYSTLRRAVVGDEIRGLQKTELQALTRVLEQSMDFGAFGLSSGLSYAHEIIVSELELFELAKVVKKKGGLFSIHLRNESSEVVEAVEEALEIARSAAVNTKISHLKVKNEQNWHLLPDVLSYVEAAFHQGSNVHFDVYPYDVMWQPLYTYLPKWAIEGGRSAMLRHFSDPTQRNKLLTYLNSQGVKFSEIVVASTANKLNFAGKTLGLIAKNLGQSSEQTVLNLIENGGSEVMVFEKNLNSDQVSQLVVHPLSFVATDGAGFSGLGQSGLVHPRSFGTATKFLNQVLADKAMTLESAIRKLTLGPAEKLGLKKRGRVAIGNFADLVIFDPKTIKDAANYQNPYSYSKGVPYVFVNGKAVVFAGQLLKSFPGTILRKNN